MEISGETSGLVAPEVWSHISLFLEVGSLQRLARVNHWFRSFVFELPSLRLRTGTALRYEALELLPKVRRVEYEKSSVKQECGKIRVSSPLELEILMYRLEGDLIVLVTPEITPFPWRVPEDDRSMDDMGRSLVTMGIAMIRAGIAESQGRSVKNEFQEKIWGLFRERIRRYPQKETCITASDLATGGRMDSLIQDDLVRYVRLRYIPGSLVADWEPNILLWEGGLRKFLREHEIRSLTIQSDSRDMSYTSVLSSTLVDSEVQELVLSYRKESFGVFTSGWCIYEDAMYILPSILRFRILVDGKLFARLARDSESPTLSRYSRIFPNLTRDDNLFLLLNESLQTTVSSYLLKFPHTTHLKILGSSRELVYETYQGDLLEATESEFEEFLGLIGTPVSLWRETRDRFPELSFLLYVDL